MMGSLNSSPNLSYKEKKTEKKKRVLCNSSKKTKISRVQKTNITIQIFPISRIEKNLEEKGKDIKKENKTHK
jgi:hypothetical protein